MLGPGVAKAWAQRCRTYLAEDAMTSANFMRQIETADPSHSRRRLISFRLTEDEHAALKHLSMEQGAHSLSDFVRSRVCAILASRDCWEDELASANRDFARQAAGLHAAVERLAQLLKQAQAERMRPVGEQEPLSRGSHA